jgi:hypothetical protein
MQPFVSVAASLVPELVPLIAGDQAGTLEPTIIRTVTETTRAASAADARRLLTANDKLAAQLQTRLKKIAAVAQKIQSNDVLLLSEDWAAPAANGGIAGATRPAGLGVPDAPPPAPPTPPAAPDPTPTEAALDLRKLLLKERVLEFREAQFERKISRRWIQKTPVLVSLILGVAAICTALVITTKDVLQADAAQAIAQANERAADKMLAAARINAATAAAAVKTAAKPAPVSAAPIPPPAPETPAQVQQDQLQKLLASDPHKSLTCNPANAVARLHALQAQFPAGQPQVIDFFLQNATTCAPPERKLTTTQSFYSQAALTAPIGVTTIFIQYPSPSQAGIAVTLAAKLQKNPLYYVPAPQQVSPAIAPRLAETNYYTPADAEAAAAVTSLVNTISDMPRAHVNFFHESFGNGPSGVVEIWFPRGH